MRKAIFVLVILLGFILSPSYSFSSLNNNCTSITQVLTDEWVEYVQIDGIWYQITHYSDGTINIIQASGIPPSRR